MPLPTLHAQVKKLIQVDNFSTTEETTKIENGIPSAVEKLNKRMEATKGRVSELETVATFIQSPAWSQMSAAWKKGWPS